MVDSRIRGFYKKSVPERVKEIAAQSGLSKGELKSLESGGLSPETAGKLIENVVGLFSLPLGIATNFKINGRDYLVPMATEEPSVVAAASNAAKMAREKGGFKAEGGSQLMIGQLQVVDADPEKAGKKILEKKDELIKLADKQDPVLVEHGGGVQDIETRVIESREGRLLVIHLTVDVQDAMGANAVNTMCEALAGRIEELTGGRVVLRILSNYAVKRLVKASAVFPKDVLGGGRVVDNIIKAYALADADVYRAVTHNKGVMNGISAVVRATGNDTRAVEAACHAYAGRGGRYRTLTEWSVNRDGDLEGGIEVPLALGVVGGATRSHPVAKTALKILGVKNAAELSEVVASVGLAQNLAALRALADEGIQLGHMKLHARNIAVTAGADGETADIVAEEMIKAGMVRVDKAREIISKLKKNMA
jgi:hydroxymethylglutaryl-CoA reductase